MPQAPIDVLFYRNLRAFSGGHLKVFHYFTHVESSGQHRARIAFSDTTAWDSFNPWLDRRKSAEPAWSTDRGDVLFLAGMDWRVALAAGVRESGKPVINLIQHVRHADPAQDVHPFLSERAIRVCVSAEVETAILETGKVVGPTFVIPNGIEAGADPRATPDNPPARRQPVLIVATKNQAFARDLNETLQAAGITTTLHDRFVPRPEFLDTLSRHAVTVFCPDPTEGFYLPALEGMRSGTFVIAPDCVGNRSFCLDGETCLMPTYSLPAMRDAVRHALSLDDAGFETVRTGAATMAASHTLAEERKRFLEILNDVDALWDF